MFNVSFTVDVKLNESGKNKMLIQMQSYLRSKLINPTDRYLKKDSFGTSRTQEVRRPDRTDVVSAYTLNKINKTVEVTNTNNQDAGS